MKLLLGDCLDKLKELEENSVDSIVTDPPYGLGFMGKAWDIYDKSQFGVKGNEGENDLKVKKNFNALPRYRSDNSFQDFSLAWAKEALRVAKPGAYLLSFGGTRTFHRLACAIEDAGWEIRDCVMWVYASGFPKSHNVGKAIDKIEGNEREEIPSERHGGGSSDIFPERNNTITTKGNSPWEGWGTALKPSWEPIIVARKPLGTGNFDVVKAVERAILDSGLLTTIIWQKDSTAQIKPTRKKMGDVSDVNERMTQNIENDTEQNSGLSQESGTPSIPKEPKDSRRNTQVNSSEKFLGHTGTSVPVAEKQNQTSLPSTTSTAVEQRTDEGLRKFITNSKDGDFLMDFGFFVGTVIGDLGLESVLIKRNEDGTLVWPKELPKFVPNKPLSVADNVKRWGTGAMNIDGSRVGSETLVNEFAGNKNTGMTAGDTRTDAGKGLYSGNKTGQTMVTGRWPANLIHDGSEEVVGLFPRSKSTDNKWEGENNAPIYGKYNKGIRQSVYSDEGSAARFFYCAKSSKSDRNEGLDGTAIVLIEYGICDNDIIQGAKKVQLLVGMDIFQVGGTEGFGTQQNDASAWNTLLFGKDITGKYQKDIKSTILTTTNSTIVSQIYNWLALLLTKEYTADVSSGKMDGGNHVASAEECKELVTTISEKMVSALGVKNALLGMRLKISVKEGRSSHPTVKPTSLMRYLCKLVTRPGGTVLDPFMGSGSTGKAAKLEGFNFIGIEKEEEYLKIAEARINAVKHQQTII